MDYRADSGNATTKFETARGRPNSLGTPCFSINISVQQQLKDLWGIGLINPAKLIGGTYQVHLQHVFHGLIQLRTMLKSVCRGNFPAKLKDEVLFVVVTDDQIL